MSFKRIGETFDFRLDKDTVIRLKVKGDGIHTGCKKCYFNFCSELPTELRERIPTCISAIRPDHKGVHFIEEK